MNNRPQISVLMSVYNETEKMLRESVDSIINQTMPEFELIVVCDKPEREKEISDILKSYHDARIKSLCNEKNIGLAMSINKAFDYSQTDIIARMDADDIAEKDRFEKQIRCFNDGNIDFVFSRYTFIDEKSKMIQADDQEHIPQELLSQRISLDPHIIHHPTVMFTRELFEKVGGYRDFPCSQDADLWLRMQEAGCRFLMIPDKLLRYRMNSNSVSSKRWFQQQLTIHYIMNLSIERLKNGNDSFSKEDYDRYLSQNGVNNESKASELRKSEDLLVKAAHLRQNGKKIKPLLIRAFVFTTSSTLRNYYLSVMKKKRLLAK